MRIKVCLCGKTESQHADANVVSCDNFRPAPICNCVAPAMHHLKCTTDAAWPSSLCASCQLCWELEGPCAAPETATPPEPPDERAELERLAAAPTVDESIG